MSKVVLITGGSSGIGKSVGELLNSKGFIVYGTSRNPENYPNSLIRLIALDVTQKNSITSCVNSIIQETGKIDVLINNAGAGINGPLEEIPEEEIQRNFNINFFGPLNVIKAVLPQMRKQHSGLIINITSIASYMGLPFRGVYSASKAALEITTESYRLELKDFNIQMTNLAPGDVATNIAAGRYHAPVLNDSPYKEKYSSILKAIDNHVDQGNDPQKVADKILQIINTKHPKIHYKVGAFMQKFSIIIKRILPEKVYENMLRKHYKL
jgi:short-subunit dehydrogenase